MSILRDCTSESVKVAKEERQKCTGRVGDVCKIRSATSDTDPDELVSVHLARSKNGLASSAK